MSGLPDGSSALLAERRAQTIARINELQLLLAPLEDISIRPFCVYATGSVGRLEVSTHSDLDLFVIGEKLTRIEQIQVQARLIEATRTAGFPDFSGDGEFLGYYETRSFIEKLGRRDENHLNVFTARMLLLLESRPLFGAGTYQDAVMTVLRAYWRDHDNHPDTFLPVFLCNDIIRYWKELCVNYEARRELNAQGDRDVPRDRLKNHKLKYSRMLTCFSAIAQLCGLVRRRSRVALPDAFAMTQRTPTERLEALASEIPSAAGAATDLLAQYVYFLRETDHPKHELFRRFASAEHHRTYKHEAKRFGDTMAELLRTVGEGTDLLRYLLV